MKIEILDNNKTQIKVCAEIQPRKMARDKRVDVDTGHIVEFLHKEGVKFGSCLRASSLNNYGRDNPNLCGVWIFRPAEPQTKKIKKAPTTKKRSARASTKNTREREEDQLLGTEDLE